MMVSSSQVHGYKIPPSILQHRGIVIYFLHNIPKTCKDAPFKNVFRRNQVLDGMYECLA